MVDRPTAGVGRGAARGVLLMKRLVFAIGALALGLTATAPAHADYAIRW